MEIQVQIAQDYISAFITIVAKEGDTDFTFDVSDLEKSLAEAGVVVEIEKEVLVDIVKKRIVNKILINGFCLKAIIKPIKISIKLYIGR